MLAPTNNAAFLLEPCGPYTVKAATYFKPGPGEVVIKNSAVALNPIDQKLQQFGKVYPFPKSYPAILGSDIAGEVYEVGEGVSGFKKGDRIIGMSNWYITSRPNEGGFQNYTTCKTNIIAHLPSNIPFTSGSVLPLALSTASMGLYTTNRLNLPFPQSTTPKPINKTLLVWGGSSSTGSAAIQLAVASGLTIIATASSKNHAFVKSLGANVVLDYNDDGIKEKLVEAIKGAGGEFAGALDAIAIEQTWRACVDVVKELGGGKVATFSARANLVDIPDGVEVFPVNDTATIGDHKEIGEAIWGKFIPEALKTGTLKPLPEPIIVGKGLEKVEEGIVLLQKGVSAAKVVVEL